MIKPLFVAGAIAATLVLNSKSAQADQVLLFDSFDSYADSVAFSNVWNEVIAAKVTGTLTNDTSVSSPNSVNYDLTGNQRNGRVFAESGVPSATNVLTFSFDFYDSNAALSPYRQYANLQDGPSPTGSSQLIAMGLNNNQTSAANGGNYYMARILGYTPTDTGGSSGSFFKLNNAGAPLRSTGWHNLKVVISDQRFDFYVDGILSRTVTNTLTLRSYDVVRLGSGLSSTATVSFDNVLVSVGAPKPNIEIQLLPGNEISVSWPIEATDYSLEANSDLSTTNWQAVAETPVEVDGKNVITNSVTNSATFYRLIKAE